MRSIQAAPLTMAILLTACGGDPAPPEDNKSTDTKMEAVDVIDGTISDDMVDLDTADTADSADANATGDAAGQPNADSDSDSSDAAETQEEAEAAE